MGNHSNPAKQRQPTLRLRTFDVEAAYLKGKFQESEVHHVRPPIGYRTFAHGNVPIVWRLHVKAPLYGEADAGRIWNRTVIQQFVGVQQISSLSSPNTIPAIFRRTWQMALAWSGNVC